MKKIFLGFAALLIVLLSSATVYASHVEGCNCPCECKDEIVHGEGTSCPAPWQDLCIVDQWIGSDGQFGCTAFCIQKMFVPPIQGNFCPTGCIQTCNFHKHADCSAWWEISCDCKRHTVCQNFSCVSIPGEAPNECSKNSDCRETHTECGGNGNCVTVEGPGDNQCSSCSDCGGYTTCQGNQCTMVCGSGSNQCGGSSGCSHTECNASFQCATVSGSGINQCTGSSDCSHLACNASHQCVTVAGKGENQCQVANDCLNKHTICQSGSCVLIDGAGTNQCSGTNDCSHTECEGGSCATIQAAGTNQCSSSTDCKHTVCNSASQCVWVTGTGANQCQSSENCPHHTECIQCACVDRPGAGANQCAADADCKTGSECRCLSSADCPAGKSCCGGNCTAVTCTGNASCNDNDACTVDSCSNPGACNSQCQNAIIPDCSCNGQPACSQNSDCPQTPHPEMCIQGCCRTNANCDCENPEPECYSGCAINADCPKDFACKDGTCYPKCSCSCPAPNQCQDGICLPPPNCQVSAQSPIAQGTSSSVRVAVQNVLYPNASILFDCGNDSSVTLPKETGAANYYGSCLYNSSGTFHAGGNNGFDTGNPVPVHCNPSTVEVYLTQPCGDGSVVSPEECDPKASPSCGEGTACNPVTCQCDTVTGTCGDGIINGLEQCDPARNPTGCQSNSQCMDNSGSNPCTCQTLPKPAKMVITNLQINPVSHPKGESLQNAEVIAQNRGDETCNGKISIEILNENGTVAQEFLTPERLISVSGGTTITAEFNSQNPPAPDTSRLATGVYGLRARIFCGATEQDHKTAYFSVSESRTANVPETNAVGVAVILVAAIALLARNKRKAKK